MLPREDRLKSSKDITNVQKKGRFCASGNIKIRFLPSQLKKTRAAFLVGIKVSKSSVCRNRIKRIVTEIFRRKLSGSEKHWDVVVAVRKKEEGVIEPEKLKSDMAEALEKCDLFRKSKK